jgi:glycosyltransferase involved in cell wall biosynthesis
MVGPGSSPHVYRLAAALAGRGHELHIVTEDKFAPFPQLAGLRYHPYPANGNFAARAAAATRIIRGLNPDLLHTHAINHGGYIGVASGFHPHVLMTWGSDVFLYPNRSKADRLFTWLAVRGADLVLSPSSVMQEELSRLGRKTGNEIMMWGLDLQHFRYEKEEGEAFRASLEIDRQAKVIFSPRILAPLYNQDIMLEAFLQVASAHPDAVLVLSRMHAEPEYERSLRQKAEALGIAAQLRWIDAVDYKTLPAAYGMADVILSIPSSDGMPMSVMEAMACERLVVACNQPSLERWYAGCQSITLVTPRNVSEVAGGVSRFLGLNTDVRKALGEKARQFMFERVDRNLWLGRLEAYYEALLKEPRGSYGQTLRSVITPRPTPL